MRNRIALPCLLLAACSGADSPTQPVDTDIDGHWTFEQTVANQTEAVICRLAGRMVVANGGSTGTLDLDESFCVYLIDASAPDGPEYGTAPIDFGDQLSDGVVTGRTLALRSGRCTYDGSLFGSPVQRIDGSVTCSLTIEGEYVDVMVAGTWSAER